ncbi:MAG: site-specific integrase, partial [Desulfobacterales bacterium]|nr:site-specific integrase [Desulfobacterales bacterium]
MSVYLVSNKGWRYDFTLKGERYTEAWFKTKTEAKQAEAKRREEIKTPKEIVKTLTDITFLEMINLRLDHVKAYNSQKHYGEHYYLAKKWVKIWGKLDCKQISQAMVEGYIFERKKISAFVANKEIRYLRAAFNFAKAKNFIEHNPLDGMKFIPIEKRIKYVPSIEDVNKILAIANSDVQDYLITIIDTMGRMSEINLLKWDDVDLEQRFVILYTRKKKGGNLTPRKIPMTKRLYEILHR